MSKKNRLLINFSAFANSIAEYSRTLFLSVLLVAIISMAACSSVPNTINPAEWYKNTVNFIAGEDVQKKESGAQTDKEKTYARGTQTNKAHDRCWVKQRRRFGYLGWEVFPYLPWN